jgi:succinate dehydrogenase / fumarate reductase cytochrome b subunit
VSTAIAPDYAVHEVGGRGHFLLRRLHSLTGLMFGGYLVIHLIVNATLAEGVRHFGQGNIYQQQVDKIHSLPFLLAVEWTFIYLPILYHTFYGIWIVATGQPNVERYGYIKNWFYTLQRVSAIILIFFIAFHVLGMKGFFGQTLKFDPVNQAAQSAARHVNSAWWIWGLVYPIGILASCFHLANGFWTAGITWGLTVSSQAIRRWGVVCAVLFVLTFGCGMTALVALVRMGPQPVSTTAVQP